MWKCGNVTNWAGAPANQKLEMMKNKVENGPLPSASADGKGKERNPCLWGFSPCLTFGLKPVSVAPPCHPSAKADGNNACRHFQLSRHCERSEAIQTNDTKRPLDCFTARSSPFAMTFHARHFDPLDCARGRLRARGTSPQPRHFDRSARRMSARSGEISCQTQAVWEVQRVIAGDSSTSLRSARNDGESGCRVLIPRPPLPAEAV